VLADPESIVARLKSFQATVRDLLVRSRASRGLNEVRRDSAADTIYQIDTLVEPVLEDFCRDWARTTPLVLIAEGIEPAEGAGGAEGVKVFPEGAAEEDAEIRVIVDPIDGTRGLMYDKRAAWALAGVAPNRGDATRLRDIEVAVMTELPDGENGPGRRAVGDQRAGGAGGARRPFNGSGDAFTPAPSAAAGSITASRRWPTFFPGPRRWPRSSWSTSCVTSSAPADVTKATVFDDQYICTGGQFYELIVGHDRFNADVRPLLYKIQSQPPGLCCHPYDCATWLIAEEAGVILTDALGQPARRPARCDDGAVMGRLCERRLARENRAADARVFQAARRGAFLIFDLRFLIGNLERCSPAPNQKSAIKNQKFRPPLVRPRHLHQLVVKAQDEKRRRPLPDEQCVLIAAHELEGHRRGDRPAGHPEERVGRELGGLLLDGAGDGAFAVFGGVMVRINESS
jgi:hypothetical protein